MRLIIDAVLRVAGGMDQAFLMVSSIIIISLIMIMDKKLLILFYLTGLNFLQIKFILSHKFIVIHYKYFSQNKI